MYMETRAKRETMDSKAPLALDVANALKRMCGRWRMDEALSKRENVATKY
jgi:hypothetical protein